MIRSLFFFAGVILLLFACNRGPYADTNKAYRKNAKQLAKTIAKSPLSDSFETAPWVGTTNFNLRKPNFVIIHHTAQNSCDQTLRTFTLTRTQVSAHYVICRDGKIYHMLNDYLRAWHAGVSRWGNSTDINSNSIGIEIDNNGTDSFSRDQITSLVDLLGKLKRAHGIPASNFIGHSDIAPKRKVDPNVTFPWKELAGQGFGLWWDDTTGVQPPPGFNAMQGLRIIGYDIRDSVAAVGAFKRKFEGIDKASSIDSADRKIIYTLYYKYL